MSFFDTSVRFRMVMFCAAISSQSSLKISCWRAISARASLSIWRSCSAGISPSMAGVALPACASSRRPATRTV